MSGFQQKCIRHAKKQESMGHTQRKKKAVNTSCPWGSPDVGLTI